MTNESLITGYTAYTDAAEFGTVLGGDAPASVESVGWTAVSVAAYASVQYEC